MLDLHAKAQDIIYADQEKKLRVVFNASRPTLPDFSLNDVLSAGPKFHINLCRVLTRCLFVQATISPRVKDRD